MAGSKIYMIGPSFRTQGGISSVLCIYEANYKDSLGMEFIPSYSGHKRLKDIYYFVLCVLRVLWICLWERSPVFHIHTASKGSYLRKSIIASICKVFNKTVIIHIHGAMFDKFLENSRPKKKQQIIKFLNKADKLVVLSESWRRYFFDYVPARNIKVIYNPSSTYDEKLEKKENVIPKILFMGRLGQRKGVYDLIEAAKKIKEKDFILTLYGDGEVDRVKEIVDRYGLSKKIEVNGWVSHSEIGKLYDDCDILVLPSYAEGLPMSVLEAIGKGLAIVSTNVGGIAEAVLDGENGFIVSPGDVERLSEKLELLITNPDLRGRMGKRSHEIAGIKFSIHRIGKELDALYSECKGR
ncbi:MAG: glycosyltransferase family 4 protein [Bacillota bacterium]